MAKSMTGYGRHQAIVGNREIVVEVRSVNHRYFDFNCRVPRAYGFLEERLKTLTQGYVTRGKVELYVSVTGLDGQPTEVRLNRQLLEGYLFALRQIIEEYGVRDDLSVSTLAKNTEIFNVVRQDEDAEEVWRDVEGVAVAALTAYRDMRAAEGERLSKDLLERLCAIEATLPEIDAASARSVVDQRERVTALLAELLGAATVDSGRIATEVALYADRISVTEEVVRLASHIGEMRKLLYGDMVSGRKMDFLLQEMNREMNTIGSKCQRSEIAMLVVDNKAELEKIREQVQNLE
ncbi:MAG TPA: YicC/YloC family endoribonuclease [Candidatus Acidoferrum sp.]|nr:YicC/YloC family endoribonuclease [Candidatus Acidoferrum sp.]